MEALLRHACAWHADRPSRAMCMSCRKFACEECTTLSDGIHYCFECLAERHQAANAAPAVVHLISMLVLSVLVAFAIVRLLAGLGAALTMGLS